MSAKTIVTRSALYAAAAALGTAGLLTSPAAHADSCTVNGGLLVLTVHRPGRTYEVQAAVQGSKISGNVTSTNTGEAQAAGTVSNGIIAGNAIDFIVDWGDRFGGGATHFRGTVGADGFAHGTASGSAAHSADKPDDVQFEQGDWDSNGPLNCGTDGQPANQPASQQPKQGPTVTVDKGATGVTFHVTDRSGVASQCTYSSEGFESNFGLPANGSFDLFVPAIRLFKQRTGTITCDNGTSTNTSVFF